MTSYLRKYLLPYCSSVILLALLVPVSFGQTNTALRRARIQPTLVTLQPGEQQSFKVIFLASRLMAAKLAEKVTWAVNDIPGGNETLGAIDSNGLYRAPKKIPTPPEIHICAKAENAGNPYLWATVLLGDKRPVYKRLRGWSEPAGRSPHFKTPHGIALDHDGNILIADMGNNRVTRFTANGKFLGDIGLGDGYPDGHFMQPRLVDVDKTGRIFVIDRKSDRPRIQVFSPDGNFQRVFAVKGAGPGQILRAHGMAFDSQERLFVTDVDNMRVNVYAHSGEFLYTFGKDGMNPGEFNAPHGMALDRNGDVFVQSFYGPCQKLTAKGKFILAFARGNPPDGPIFFHSVSSDRWGNVYLTIAEGPISHLVVKKGTPIGVLKYNNNGDFITAIRLSSIERPQVSWVAVDQDDRLYALYSGKNQMGVEILGEY